MFTIYVYVLDTLADWELGYITSELHSGRFFKRDAERVSAGFLKRTHSVLCSQRLAILKNPSKQWAG